MAASYFLNHCWNIKILQIFESNTIILIQDAFCVIWLNKLFDKQSTLPVIYAQTLMWSDCNGHQYVKHQKLIKRHFAWLISKYAGCFLCILG